MEVFANIYIYIYIYREREREREREGDGGGGERESQREKDMHREILGEVSDCLDGQISTCRTHTLHCWISAQQHTSSPHQDSMKRNWASSERTIPIGLWKKIPFLDKSGLPWGVGLHLLFCDSKQHYTHDQRDQCCNWTRSHKHHTQRWLSLGTWVTTISLSKL